MAFSLRELRELEQHRISDEQTKRREQDEAKVRAAADIERIKLETEAAAVRAEREERYRIEAARAETARQERLQLEAHEIAERTRHQAMLDAERMRQELELRRIEANKKRPKWMLVVTAVASLAVVGLVGFSVQRMNETATAKTAQQVAQEDAIKSRLEADQAAAKLAVVTTELNSLDKDISAAIAKVDAAASIAQQLEAKGKLARLEQQRRDAAARAEQARRDEELRKRREGVKIKCFDAVCR